MAAGWNRGMAMGPEQRAKISASLTGLKRSQAYCEYQRIVQRAASTPEVRAKISLALKGRRRPTAHVMKAVEAWRRARAGNPPSCLELALRGLLAGAGYAFEEQVRFGRYVVDAWVPSHGLVFEADCTFWFHHQDAAREARRDAYLTARGALAVVHLTEKDLL